MRQRPLMAVVLWGLVVMSACGGGTSTAKAKPYVADVAKGDRCGPKGPGCATPEDSPTGAAETPRAVNAR